MVSGTSQLHPTPIEAPARTRQIWLIQVFLAAMVMITSILVSILQPNIFLTSGFGVGVFAISVLTIVALAVPWTRLPPAASLSLPFLDALAVGLIAGNTDLRFAFFWVLPVMWVAVQASVIPLLAMLALIGGNVAIFEASDASPLSELRVFIIMISLFFVGIAAHLVMRQPRALRILLERQATRLTRTVNRRVEQDRHTTAMLNGIDIGIAALSSTGGIVSMNSTYIELYGADPQAPDAPPRSVEYHSLRGMPIARADRPIARAARGELLTAERVWLFTANAQWRVLSITTQLLPLMEDDSPTILLVVHDVTAIAQAEMERERLTAIASHELKHPLTVLIGNADLLLDEEGLAPGIRSRLETMHKAGERMLEMATSMLGAPEAAHSLSGRDSFARADLRKTLRDSAESFRSTANSGRVTLGLIADEELPVVADVFRMRQVIDNLVSNAIKYTLEGGTVRIIGRRDGETVSIRIDDSGVGIAEEDLPHVGKSYFRGANAEGTAKGTGLGMSIANEIISAHGGSLKISSTLGQGTSVEARLPGAYREQHVTSGASG